ncbi:MAG: hydrolase [Rhodoglobus sp.]|nr:hydrolase [Rhodoglobus sp.]
MTLLFIFDMDDVLYDYDWRDRMAELTKLTGLPLNELRRRWWHDDGDWAAEAGAFDTADAYHSAYADAIGMPIDEAEFMRARAGAMTEWPDSLAAVRRASELGQITLLTNNGPLISKHLRAIAPGLVDLFGDHLFTSSDYGARKPDPVVFERVLDAYDTVADDAFFADDMLVNVEGAASIGITAYHFGTSVGMLAAIEEFAAGRPR